MGARQASTLADVTAVLKTRPEVEVLLAAEEVKTALGAKVIRRAELDGLRRPNVIRAAERRIEQLEGREAAGQRVQLAVLGEAVETASLRPRPLLIAAGVGSAVRTSDRARKAKLEGAMAEEVRQAQAEGVTDPATIWQRQIDAKNRALEAPTED